MIAVAMALLGVQAETAMPPDVVVVAERVRQFKARTRKDRRTGLVRCEIRRSTGGPKMDGAICEAVLACDAVVTTLPQAKACMEGRMPAIMARFAPSQRHEGEATN